MQQYKFGGHAQHTAAPFVDGTGAFPHSGLLFNCITGEDKGRRAVSDHSSWQSNHDGHPDFVVNLSSRACGACRLVLRVHALELGKSAAQRDVSGSSAGGISDPHESRGAGAASTSRAIPHCYSPRDPDVSRALSHASNNALLVGLAVQNAALLRKLKLKQHKRCVLSLFHFLLCCLW